MIHMKITGPKLNIPIDNLNAMICKDSSLTRQAMSLEICEIGQASFIIPKNTLA